MVNVQPCNHRVVQVSKRKRLVFTTSIEHDKSQNHFNNLFDENKSTDRHFVSLENTSLVVLPFLVSSGSISGSFGFAIGILSRLRLAKI